MFFSNREFFLEEIEWLKKYTLKVFKFAYIKYNLRYFKLLL